MPWCPRSGTPAPFSWGAYSPEPLGDYYAGPNHILPTGGTARFYSVLNVETFMKKTSIISYTREALAEAADDIIAMAEAEGLQAHANAIRIGRRSSCNKTVNGQLSTVNGRWIKFACKFF